MSDPRSIKRSLDQTKVKEVPGGIPGFKTFFESGTWTPEFIGTTIAGTFTYPAAGQKGLWARIGNQVFIHALAQISAVGVAPTGNMRIKNLPFTSANLGLDFSLSVGFMSNINTSANIVQLTALVLFNTALIGLFESFDNIASVAYPAGNFTNVNATIELSGAYQV